MIKKSKTNQPKITTIVCPNCDGTGIDPNSIIDFPIEPGQLASKQKITNKCPDCNGTGRVQAIITKKTTLPPIK